MKHLINEHDLRKNRCRQLGHEVSFLYCRSPGGPIPCRTIFDCWWEIFDIATFVKSHFDEETVCKISAPPPAKAVTLMDLIEEARKRVQSASSSSTEQMPFH